jgi:hypothetical protein
MSQWPAAKAQRVWLLFCAWAGRSNDKLARTESFNMLAGLITLLPSMTARRSVHVCSAGSPKAPDSRRTISDRERLHCSLNGDRVSIAGRAVLYLEGHIEV